MDASHGREPWPSAGVWGLVAALGCAVGCYCGPTGAPCSTDGDCPSGYSCQDNRCGIVGLGDGGGGCAVACGGRCCSADERCEAGECHKDCGTAARCGGPGAEKCCAANQVCYLDDCVVPGAPCSTSAQCQPGEYCDPALGKCLPLGPPTACEYHPPAGQFAPTSLWKYTPPAPYDQIMMTPVVIDVNGDGVPDVLGNFFHVGGSYYHDPGVMRALSGDDGRVLWTTLDAASDNINPPSGIAAGDLDGSGRIVAVTESAAGPLIAFDAKTGAKLWTSHDGAGNPAACNANWGGPALVDLNGDGAAEIVCGLAAFDRNGKVLWNRGKGGGAVGPVTVVADLDADGKPEVTDGSQAFRADGTPLGWTGAGFAGLPAIGDFVTAASAIGRDGKPEIVVVNGGQMALVNGQTGAVIAQAPMPSWNGSACIQGGGQTGNGGPPTVADFDGDGQAEVGAANLDCYTMFKVEPLSGKPAWKVVWSRKVQDHSSSVTGSSVFDFEGDGKAEVVYGDELALHVYNGADGTEIFTKPHCTGTTYEYPVIVDVNANGRADIVMAVNTYAAGGLGCAAGTTPGIQVFRDAKDNWVNTRRIWNQHTYHVTNVCDGADYVCGGRGAPGNSYGRVPKVEHSNWVFNNAPAGNPSPPLNNYRQNVQGEGMFNAPDLAGKDFSADLAGCPSKLAFRIRVVNQGALGVLPGIKVAFYVSGSPRKLLGTGKTQGRLLPGQSEVVVFTWSPPAGQAWPVRVVAVVDDDGTGAGQASECKEDNNEAGPIDAFCPTLN